MDSDRRIAVIMFTDMVGYTVLMAKDESNALKILAKNRSIQKGLIDKYHGKFLKEMGDGILAAFNSSSDAVMCAESIQKQVVHHNIQLRIGLHQGEVIFQNHDVFGEE